MANVNTYCSIVNSTTKKEGKTVIIAYDGSDYAKYAMKFYADSCYTPTDQIIVVYCVELSDIVATEKTINGLNESCANFSIDHEVLKQLIDQEIERIKTRLIEFAVYMREIKLNGIVKSTQASSPGEGVLNLSRELNADMIVTGCRGHSKLRRTFLGSVSGFILHHSHIPVMVIPHHKESHHHKH
ncbi:universal stress protein Sll1388-like [Mytilus californianus]|uniref:universal stress protein Sll1388-like n=1 Tax=Mytilus californianus TaxID=6549 RepID=UPI00224582EE|nr:universal stress protein Sll1388-like [Mytilus californianus]